MPKRSSQLCELGLMLPTSFLNLLASFANVFNDPHDQLSLSLINGNKPSDTLRFELRQFHTVTSDAQVLFHDAAGLDNFASLPSDYLVRTRRLKSHRPSSREAFLEARRKSLVNAEVVTLGWDEEDTEAPDVERRDTLVELAKMTNNAYLNPGETGWYDLGGNWNVVSPFSLFFGASLPHVLYCKSYPFGWEPDDDGFRGHVFATPDNSTVVLAIKGTSAAFIRGGGPTAKKDKFNDNLLFSCCCARIDWTWTTVCGCYRGGWKCDQDCLEKALIEESLFYPIGTVRLLSKSIQGNVN